MIRIHETKKKCLFDITKAQYLTVLDLRLRGLPLSPTSWVGDVIYAKGHLLVISFQFPYLEPKHRFLTFFFSTKSL